MNTHVLRKATRRVREQLTQTRVQCALILGSGWNGVADSLGVRESLDYERIPYLGATGVEGHAGRLVLARNSGQNILVFQGRRHWYEGVGWEPVALPVYLAKEMGARSIIITNASGGINRSLEPGSLMLIRDHINAMGSNPLVGPHDPFWGSRFPDQTRVYDDELSGLIRTAAEHINVELSAGVYAATSGPTYETAAETRVLANMGADVVGMSTVPEAILANAAGLRVAALSCITNMATGIAETPLSHAEVLAATTPIQRRMSALFTEFFSLLSAQPFLPGDKA